MRKYADVSGKIDFEKRPRKVLLFAKSPTKFYGKADLDISFSYQWMKKIILQAKLSLDLYFDLVNQALFSAAWF